MIDKWVCVVNLMASLVNFLLMNDIYSPQRRSLEFCTKVFVHDLCMPLVRSLSSNWGQSVGRCDRNVQKVTNTELCLGQSFVVICSLLTRACNADLTHLEMIVPEIGVHYRKIKVCTFLPGIGIDVAHQ